MPRKRMIDPGFWSDPHISQLTILERLLFLGCISMADDEGRLLANPTLLRAQIFPYDQEVTPERVKEMRDRITEIDKNVILYEVNGVKYISLEKWGRYQKPQYKIPSIFPPPPRMTNVQTNEEQNVCQIVDQVSLGKVSIGKDSSSNATTTEMKQTERAKTIAAYVEAYVPHLPGKEPPISEYPTDATLRDIEYMADVWGDDALQGAIKQLKKPKLPPKYLEQIIKRWKKEGKVEPRVTPRERDILREKWGV